jgi:pyruvate dehydrogenase E1 component alpha subunit
MLASTVLGPRTIPDLEPVQLLRPDAERTTHDRYSVSLSNDELLALYAAMATTRALDREFTNLQRQGQLALYASCMGQEAAQVGLAAALDVDDWLFPQYRELGAWVWRGVDPGGVGLHWRGTWHGGFDLIEHRSAPMCIPIGTQALHAVGYAMGVTLDGASNVAVACIGDGATSEGDVHEALNFAAVYSAPCIFFVQNNQWAISVPVAEQTKSASIAHKAIAYGMPGVRCDGNDVLATYAVVKDAASRARTGGGPTLVEAVTYRMAPHTTSDDPTRYRIDDEVDLWAKLDPIDRIRRLLVREEILTDPAQRVVEDDASAAAARLRESVVDAPDVDPDELFAHVFVEPTPALLEQREALRNELHHGYT